MEFKRNFLSELGVWVLTTLLISYFSRSSFGNLYFPWVLCYLVLVVVCLSTEDTKNERNRITKPVSDLLVVPLVVSTMCTIILPYQIFLVHFVRLVVSFTLSEFIVWILCLSSVSLWSLLLYGYVVPMLSKIFDKHLMVRFQKSLLSDIRKALTSNQRPKD
ncbi:uncharacterized protein [Ptychodera flava]|uniref:uncharacterized protein n=1 Tax=Ptychodera flava TaxID=63121 RepID=UPI00396A10D0